ncbi:MAG: hypothetical protein ACRC6R_05995 [Bacteroidales bacterium]
MIELVGYWAGVSIYTYLLLLIPVVVFICVAESIIEWASRGRIVCGSWISKWLEKRGIDEDIIGCSFCLSLIVTGVTSIFVVFSMCGEESYTYVGLVSSVSQWAAPVFGWIASFIIVVVGSAFILRKFFDMFFGIKDKIDSLEKKDV